MSRVLLGQLHSEGHVLVVDETLRDTFALDSSDKLTVTLSVDGASIELDLAALRKAKQILGQAERQLQLRAQQALAARNLKFDFEAEIEP